MVQMVGKETQCEKKKKVVVVKKGQNGRKGEKER